jgi:type IX secretion system PorP/SprF family membrane protein
MKKVLSILALAAITYSAQAQQQTFTSQYMMNHFVLNPAAAGAQDHIPIALNFRQQWAGFNDAPNTQMISGNGALNESMGIGGIFYNDVTGPLRNVGFQASYAYGFEVSDNSKLSFGITAALSQYFLDSESFVLADEVDNTLNGAQLKSFNPDANFGAYWNGENFFAGLVVNQLMQSKFKFGDEIVDANRQVRHYFLTGGYTFDLGGDFLLEPSTLVKFVPNTPVAFDLNARLFYKENLWAGLSYRMQESAVFMFGVQRDQFRIGYAYDATMSNVKYYSGGSHEIYIEYQIGKKGSSASFQ